MAARKKAESKKFLDKFDFSAVEKPIEIANKAFDAGLGLANQVQSDFDSQFSKYAKNGEKVRNDASKSITKLRDDVVGRLQSVRDDVQGRVDSVLNSVLEYSPIATTADVRKLDTKLDKALHSAK